MTDLPTQPLRPTPPAPAVDPQLQRGSSQQGASVQGASVQGASQQGASVQGSAAPGPSIRDLIPESEQQPAQEPASRPARPAGASAIARAPQRTALVVLVGMVALAVAFVIMIFVNVTSESINALAVIATPIATMVAAYYGITLSIQQVRNERAEKEKAIARADAAVTASRETEVWAAQMESGLRVAMAKLTAAGISTDEVTKAAGTPDDFF